KSSPCRPTNRRGSCASCWPVTTWAAADSFVIAFPLDRRRPFPSASVIHRKEADMVRVVGIDHLSIRVGDFKKSKAFYGKLMPYLGFEVLGDYGNTIGWTNGKTRLWIGKADTKGRKVKHRIGNIGFHHYAFELRSRKDVDDLENFVANELDARIVDPAGE